MPQYFFFNGVDSRTYGLVTGVSRSMLPDLDNIEVKVPRRTGIYIPKKAGAFRDVGALEFKIDFAIMGNNLTDLRSKIRSVATWLYNANVDGTAKDLYFSDEKDRIHKVFFRGSTELAEDTAISEVTLEFIAPEAWASSNVERSLLFSANALTITNNGTAPTFPVFRIVPEVAITDFTLNYAGVKIYITGRTFTAWEPFIIDTKKAEIYIESSGASLLPYLSMDSRFVGFAGGSTYPMTVTGAGLGTGNIQARCTFTERYR
jgi:predicted phage tail component-like protein